jgi:hypothetical protein
MKEFIERLKQEGVFSPAGLLELEEILTGPVEDVEKDLVNLIKRENDVE